MDVAIRVTKWLSAIFAADCFQLLPEREFHFLYLWVSVLIPVEYRDPERLVRKIEENGKFAGRCDVLEVLD